MLRRPLSMLGSNPDLKRLLAEQLVLELDTISETLVSPGLPMDSN